MKSEQQDQEGQVKRLRELNIKLETEKRYLEAEVTAG